MTRHVTPGIAAFMPDAQALVRRQASPMVGILILTLSTLLLAFVLWLGFARVEQMVRAEGKVEPVGRIKLVNHPQGGRVAEIHVREGQQVAAGDALLSLDPQLEEGAIAELRGRWQVATASAARLAAEAAGTEPVFPDDLDSARPDLIAAELGQRAARAAAVASREDALGRELETREAEIRVGQAELARLKRGLGLLQKQEAAVRELAEQGYYPMLKVIGLEREASDTKGEIARTTAALAATEAAMAESRARLEGSGRDWRVRVLADLAAAVGERDRLASELGTREVFLRDRVVRAPVDGVVQDLQVRAIGQSVPANEPLLKLVPVTASMAIEARVANEDIGYVHEGMTAVVKVRAFDFLRYGTLSGTVTRIAADATRDGSGENWGYAVTVVTDGIRPGGTTGTVAISPGMTVDVELRVGERTILSFLTDRILAVPAIAFREG